MDNRKMAWAFLWVRCIVFFGLGIFILGFTYENYDIPSWQRLVLGFASIGYAALRLVMGIRQHRKLQEEEGEG